MYSQRVQGLFTNESNSTFQIVVSEDFVTSTFLNVSVGSGSYRSSQILTFVHGPFDPNVGPRSPSSRHEVIITDGTCRRPWVRRPRRRPFTTTLSLWFCSDPIWSIYIKQGEGGFVCRETSLWKFSCRDEYRKRWTSTSGWNNFKS